MCDTSSTEVSGERVCSLKISAWEYVEHVGVCIAWPSKKVREKRVRKKK